MFPTLLLAFHLLSEASATHSSSIPITWLKWGQSAVVKLDTPGYPLWPLKYQSQASWEKGQPSAVLLNLTLSADNKTLLLNHKPILPYPDSNTPPLLEAYQIPANISDRKVQDMIDLGVLNREGMGDSWRWRCLALNYDRIVRADPENGPWYNHNPTLTFRIMGFGATPSENDILNPEKQPVLHVTLTDTNHASSDDPKRNYEISKMELRDFAESYPYVMPLEREEKKCTLRSWRCPDDGLYEEGAPYYRFIWRRRFDEYGRVGSLRHAVFKKMAALTEIWEDAGAAMIMSFAILMSVAMVALGALLAWKKWAETRNSRKRAANEWDDRLLGEEDDARFGEKYADEVEGVMSPRVPVEPADGVLVDLGATES